MESANPTQANSMAPSPQALPPRRTLIFILSGLITGMLLAALDQTIVATAGPTIISDLGGLSLYAWVFSAYILSQTVMLPVFGKLSDLYGRKKFFVIGLTIFMIGSMLSGAAQNIDELIVFRAVQGIGSGASFSIALAIIGVTFPPRMRAKLQGAFASIFGIASVVGPSVGSYIVEAISWRWIFYINLPLGVASIILISIGVKESKNLKASPKVDVLGVGTLAAWVVLLMLGFLDGGTTFDWYSWQEGATFAAAAVLFFVFLVVERRATEPVLPLELFRNRTISSCTAVAFLRGIAFFAIVSFIPLFVQAGLAGSVADGRNALYGFLIPMIVASVIGGQLATRIGYRAIIFSGLSLMTFGVFLLTSISTSSTILEIAERSAVMGLGAGITFPSIIIAVQYSVSREKIGIASSLAQFMGNLGSSIGLAVLGTIQVNTFGSQLTDLLATVPPQFKGQASAFLGNPNLVGQILASPDVLAQMVKANPPIQAFIPSLRSAFASSVVPLFWASLAISITAVVASLFVTGSMRQQIRAHEIAAGRPDLEQPPPAAPA